MSIAAEAPARAIPWWLKRHETLLAIILVIALAGLGAANERFLTVDNLLNQGRLMTEIGLIALPMTFVIITGGIDLSVGAVVGLCAIMLGYSWKNFGFPLPLAIVFALAVGGLAGFVNGLVITRIKVPPLIMTIATLALYRGLAEGISQAHSVRGYPEWFYVLGQGDLFGVPTQLVILVILMVVAGVALDRTTFGRTLYAIGANETAARFSALSVDRVKLIVYTLSGLASGLAAIVLVSRVTTTRMDMGMGYELDVIAAVVLGGTSIFGGSGTIWGTAIGLAMIQLLKNGLALTGVKGDATIMVIGVALIFSFDSEFPPAPPRLSARLGGPTPPLAASREEPEMKRNYSPARRRRLSPSRLPRAARMQRVNGTGPTTCRPVRSPATRAARRRPRRPSLTTAASRPILRTRWARKLRSSMCRS